jgi:hypothetical protein
MIPQKRLWFVFNDRECELVSYSDENSFLLRKKELERIDLSRSTILPMNSSLFTFKIL